jgi:hypothetical protein
MEEGDIKLLELNNGVCERELDLLNWSIYLFKEEVAYIVLSRKRAVWNQNRDT